MLYYILLLIRDTKAYQARGRAGPDRRLYILTVWGRLGVSNRIIRSFINYLIIAVIVLFQAEIRRLSDRDRLADLPQALRPCARSKTKIDDLFQAIDFLSAEESAP